MAQLKTSSHMSLEDSTLRANKHRSRKILKRASAVFIFLMMAVAGCITFLSFHDVTPFTSDPDLIAVLLLLDMVILVIALLFVLFNIVPTLRFSSGQKDLLSSERLNARLLRAFALVSMIPVVLLTSVSVFLFDLGLESWFSERVRNALNASGQVAEAYLVEHIRGIKIDTLSIARSLSKRWVIKDDSREALSKELANLAHPRNITQAIVFDQRNGKIIGRFGFTFALEFDPIPDWAVDRARTGEAVILSNENDNTIKAITRIDNYIETYVLIARLVDSNVLSHINLTRDTVSQFERLELRRGQIQYSYSAVLILLAVILIIITVWAAFRIARAITIPIEKLAQASDRVYQGDFTTNVVISKRKDEINRLGHAFNRMVGYISNQQQELLDAKERSDSRRQFSEAVLSGVSAGVVGLNKEGRIDLPNARACELLGIDLTKEIGNCFVKIVPQFAEIIEEYKTNNVKTRERQLTFSANSSKRELLVRITPQWYSKDVETKQYYTGSVLTFDDITLLISVQRQAAWSDVARRIAHEVRNPLTPIQLSAERLRKRFATQIIQDQELYNNLLDTIIRQVGDIGRLVEEFSSFARMPKPIMGQVNLIELCKQSVLLQNVHTQKCDLTYKGLEGSAVVECDGLQISQVLTNLIKNAYEGMLSEKEHTKKGIIEVVLNEYDQAKEPAISLVVRDNGLGFPKNQMDILLEPYVTLKEQGTGLGLAIVKKIVEDHHGTIELGNCCDRDNFTTNEGAYVEIILPYVQPI